MLLKYFGTNNVSQLKIKKEVGGIKKYGVAALKLAKYASYLGFNTHCYSYYRRLQKTNIITKKPSKPIIIKYLNKKLPIIACVRSHYLYNEKPLREGHFIVVSGYDNKNFYYNDPYDRKSKKINQQLFMRALNEQAHDYLEYLLIIDKKENQKNININK